MKYVKMLGLTAVAAMALMAYVGAGTASATVLCKTADSNTCKTGWTYPSGTKIKASLTGTATLESGETVLDTCTGGTVEGPANGEGKEGEEVSGPIESLTWENCSRPTTTTKNGSLDISWISGSTNGTLSATGSEVTINTIFGSCVYGVGAKLDLGTVKGGNPATIAISTSVPKISGNFACPGTALWTANYTVTSPKPLYISTHAEV